MKIALLGYGIETRSAVAFFRRKHPDATYVVYDSRTEQPRDLPQGAEYVVDLRDGLLEVDADIVVRTPSFSPHRIKTTGTVTSVTQEFFALCPCPIIGVTGTKGKGTTASLIAHILKTAGVKHFLLGNIGTPALDELEAIEAAHAADQDVVVIYELSSFQLWDMRQSPSTAVVLMIGPEHLDVHRDHEGYLAAKANIARYQKADDTIVYFADNPESRRIAEMSPAQQKFPYSVSTDGRIMARGTHMLDVSDVAIPGAHNTQNVAAAVSAVMDFVADKDVIAEAVRSFRGLEHRLEVVRTVDDVTYVNDSYSSAPNATIAAVRAFSSPSIVIVGGKDRGLPLEELADQLDTGTVKHVILIGESRHRVAEELSARSFDRYSVCGSSTMQEIVDQSRELAEPGDIVILSPGFPSFDMFDNFTDRGNQFKSIVGLL